LYDVVTNTVMAFKFLVCSRIKGCKWYCFTFRSGCRL